MEDRYVLAVTLILLFVIVLILSVWEYTLDKNYKNTPIVNYSRSTQQNTNPPALLLGATDTDSSQNSTGLQTSSLHQPCNPGTEQSGVPNLPISYTSKCSEGQACVNSTTKGNVCLSKLGYFCKNKMDCDPTTTDECIGNICVSRTNKLNAPCNNNSDCFLSTNNTNLSCVQTDSGKRCKYDLYPLGNKCAFDQECYPDANGQEYACVQGPSSNYIVSGTGNNQGNIVLNEGMSLLVYSFVNNIEDKKVKLINNQTGTCSYYQITNFALEDYSFSPVYYPTTTPAMSTIDNGVCYNIIFYEADISTNTCIAKVNSDAKISSIENHYLKDLMTKTDDPCQSNSTKVTVGNDVYCVSNSNVKAGQVDRKTIAGAICDTANPSLGCCSIGNVPNIPSLTCTYNERLTDATEINYNFIGNEDFKTVGRCLFPSGGLVSNCNNFLRGCKQPYLCYEENYGNFCLQPLETQTCYFDDACPEGFSCIDKKCVASDSDTPNITGNSFINDAGLFYFDPTLNKYKRITVQPNDISQIGTSYTDTKLILGQNYIDSNVSKICIYDGLSFILYILTYVSENNYSCKTININQVFTHKVTDIILDPDDNILLVIKENIVTARKRSYQIAEVGTSLTLNTSFSNLSVGTSVFYSGVSGNINNQNLYNVSAINGSSLELEGITSYDANLKNGYIITYDNTMTFSDGEFSINGGIGWCIDNINDTEYSWVQTGDMFQITGGTIGVSGSIAGIGPNITLDGTSLYFYTYISKENNYNYFTISDNYNASDGSVPFIKDNRYIGQSMTYSSGAKVALYNNLVTYSITKLDENQPINSELNLNNSQAYITKQGNSFDKNGMEVGGITYAFDSDTNINFKTYKNDNKNYMLISSQIETQVDENFGVNKYVNYAQKINYNIGTCWDNNYDYQYKDSNGSCWFNFTYQNNALLPHSDNYYQSTSQGTVCFNAVNELYPNTFNVQEDLDFNIYNNVINNDASQTGTDINIINESKFRKIESNYNTNDDPIENLTFKNVDNIFKIPPVPMDGNLVSLFDSPKPGDNTFEPGQLFVTFNNTKDIDLILKYGSSEIGIVKEIQLNNQGKQLQTMKLFERDYVIPDWAGGGKSGPDMTIAKNHQMGGPQIVLVITDIISHIVNLNTEQLVCSVNRKVLTSEDESNSPWIVGNSFDEYIIKDSSKWNFYLYNYIPLTYRSFTTAFQPGSEESDNLNAPPYQKQTIDIFDGSCLFTSSKHDNYFKNINLKRCFYNKLIFPFKDNQPFEIVNNLDGVGVHFDKALDFSGGSNNGDFFNDKINSYQSNSVFSNITTFPLYSQDNDVQIPSIRPYTSSSGGVLTREFVQVVPYSDIAANALYVPDKSTIVLVQSDSASQPNIRNYTFTLPLSPIFSVLRYWRANPYFSNFFNSIYGPTIFFQGDLTNINKLENSADTQTETRQIKTWLSEKSPFSEINNYYYTFGSSCTITIQNIHKMDANNYRNEPEGILYKLYTINNLFMSTISYIDNLGNGKVFYNNQQLLNSFIISSQSSNGEKKGKGALKLNVDSTGIVIQKNNDPVITQLDQTNINAIDWPSWINLLNNNNNKYDHKIESVFYSSGNNNELSKATYYVYTSYVNNLNQKSYQMYYFGVNETIQDQALNRGVATGPATNFYTSQNLAMDSLTRRLYLIGNVKI